MGAQNPGGQKSEALRDSRAVLAQLPELKGAEQEMFFVLGLDARHRVIVKHCAAIGTADAVTVCARDVFRELVRRNCVACILAHNHPSGDCSPSPNDMSLTDRLVSAGMLLGIKVLDHVIVGEECFYSFAEHDLIQEPTRPLWRAA